MGTVPQQHLGDILVAAPGCCLQCCAALSICSIHLCDHPQQRGHSLSMPGPGAERRYPAPRFQSVDVGTVGQLALPRSGVSLRGSQCQRCLPAGISRLHLHPAPAAALGRSSGSLALGGPPGSWGSGGHGPCCALGAPWPAGRGAPRCGPCCRALPGVSAGRGVRGTGSPALRPPPHHGRARGSTGATGTPARPHRAPGHRDPARGAGTPPAAGWARGGDGGGSYRARERSGAERRRFRRPGGAGSGG